MKIQYNKKIIVAANQKASFFSVRPKKLLSLPFFRRQASLSSTRLTHTRSIMRPLVCPLLGEKRLAVFSKKGDGTASQSAKRPSPFCSFKR